MEQDVEGQKKMKTQEEEEEDQELTCTQHLCRKDNTIFREYIENTTTHGVVRIFSDRAISGRIFWLLVVLIAAGGCLNNCIDRILYLVSQPTFTTISIRRDQPITFPAVSLCNLNLFTREGLEAYGVLNLTESVLNSDLRDLSGFESGDCNSSVHALPGEAGRIELEELVFTAGHSLDSVLENCYFAGRPCSPEDFDLVITGAGLCYTFNSGRNRPVLTSSGSGSRRGFTAYVDIEQDQYSSSAFLDAGLVVIVHPQSEPPLVLDRGIAVQPGTHAFIGITQQDIIDNTQRNCRKKSDSTKFNYLQGKFNYSSPACTLDCFLSQVARRCGCSYIPKQFPPDTPEVSGLRECTLFDFCCVYEQAFVFEKCNCVSSCRSSNFITSTSYSSLPALYTRDTIEDVLNVSFDQVQSDVALVNVYFETVNVETITTSSAYSVVALLSDIGGQLGLFLGMSIISIMEFGSWLLDECIDRCCYWRKKKKHVDVESGEMERVTKV